MLIEIYENKYIDPDVVIGIDVIERKHENTTVYDVVVICERVNFSLVNNLSIDEAKKISSSVSYKINKALEKEGELGAKEYVEGFKSGISYDTNSIRKTDGVI